MTSSSSSSLLSPLASLIQQWASTTTTSSNNDDDQQQQPLLSLSSSSSSYRVLFQTSYNVKLRSQAVNMNSTEQLAIYQRAKIRPPNGTAIRDIYGPHAWLQHISSNAVARKKDDCNIIWIQTTPTPPPNSITETKQRQDQQQFDDDAKNISRIDLSQDPWGWDDDEDEDGDKRTTKPSLSDLTGLYDYIQQQIGSSKRTSGTDGTILIWDSLESFFVVHGFVPTIRFLNKFHKRGGCFQIWTIRKSMLTEQQHSQLEDLVEALLVLEDGEMTLMRQGIRERGNLVRQHLPFQLIEMDNDDIVNRSGKRYKLVEEDEEEKEEINDQGKQQQQLLADNTNQVSPSANSSSSSSQSNKKSSSSTRPRIQLQMEEEEGNETKAMKTEPSSTQQQQRPRIYLEDDDPEFDDLDEEDPDEDLDI